MSLLKTNRVCIVLAALIATLAGCSKEDASKILDRINSLKQIANVQDVTAQTGKFVINPQFDARSGFKDGLAAVRIGGEKSGAWGHIDKQGKVVINPQFGYASLFSEGLAAVRIGDEKTGKWGYIDKQGAMVINPQFDHARLFSDGLAAVRIGDAVSGRWGYIARR